MHRVIALYNLSTGAIKNAQTVTGLSEQAIDAAKYLLGKNVPDEWVVVDSSEQLDAAQDAADSLAYASKLHDYTDEQLIAVYCDNLLMEDKALNAIFEAEFDRRGLKL